MSITTRRSTRRRGAFRIVLASSAVLAALALASCSSGSSTATTTSTTAASPGGQGSTTSSTTSTATLNACRLLTLTDAQGLIGAQATQVGSGGTECNYSAGESALTIVATAPSNRQAYSAAATSGYQSFSGVGDVAAYSVNTNGTGQVTFLRGSDLVAITLRVASASGTLVPVTSSTLQQMARTAASRL
jgi:hypothetical protein